MWVLEHWPQGPLKGSLSSSQGGISSLQLLTTSACPSSRGPPCLPPCPHALVNHNLCHHASEAQEQVPCPCEIPLSQEAQTSASAAPKEECPSSPSSVPQASPKGPLLLEITRSFREPSPLALLMQGLPVQDLMKVPRAQRRKVQVPPRQPLPLRALAKILCPGKPACRWSSC